MIDIIAYLVCLIAPPVLVVVDNVRDAHARRASARRLDGIGKGVLV